jgi:diacylglycerol O-acyltransferase
LLDGGGLNITAMSYHDHIDFGYVVCPEVVEDSWQLADATAVAFTELEKAAAASPPKRASKETARRATDGASA